MCMFNKTYSCAIFMSNEIFLVLMMYLSIQEYSTRVFFFKFCDVAQWQPSTRGKNQIWLQVREDSRHFLEFCYVLVTSKNPVSKYGNLYVFALRMWWTKRHLKGFHIMGWLTSDHHYSSIDYDTLANKVKSSDHWLGILASCQMQQISYQLFPVQRV